LFGVRQEGSFNSAESMDLFNIFKATYVNTKQKRLEWMLNLMVKLGGYIGEVKLVDVEPFPKPQPTPAPAPTPIVQSCHNNQFSDDEIKVFEQFGESNDKFIVLHSEPIAWDTPSEQVFSRSQQLFDKVGEISATLTGADKDVLKLLSDGESSEAIAKALNTSVEDVAKRIATLRELEILTKGGEVNTLGKSVIENLDIPISRFEVRYTYRTRPNVPDPITQSRAFCVKLIELNRSYSRQDIDNISVRVDRDVWKYRGGWYTNPDTQVTTPFCRHEWIQQLVIAQ
jgi:hypothetical protein